MSQEHESLPIACNPTALSSTAWAAHHAHSRELFEQMVMAVEELPDGYAFHFPASVLPAVALFIEGERRCCPFLAFSVRVPPADAAITLQISGSPEAKALIAAELLASKQ